MLKVDHLKTNQYVKIVSFLLFFVCIDILLHILGYFHISIPCPILSLTGYYCPGCGISRLVLSLFSGHIYQAFRWNPFVFLLLVIFFGYVVISTITHKYVDKKIVSKILFVVIILLIGYGVLRNMELFSFLAPTNV